MLTVKFSNGSTNRNYVISKKNVRTIEMGQKNNKHAKSHCVLILLSCTYVFLTLFLNRQTAADKCLVS